MSQPKTLQGIVVSPVHNREGRPSYIELRALPEWIKGDWYVTAVLTPAEAIRLIEQLAYAIRVTTKTSEVVRS